MPGSQSIGSIGGYPYMSAADYQYFLNAVNTPNPNAVAFKGTTNTQQTTQTTQTANAPATQATATRPVVTEKKNNTGKIILGTVALIGAGLTIAAACKGPKDAKNIIDKIGQGYKAMFSKAKETIGSVVSAETGKRTISEINGKKVVTLPGEQKNIIHAAGGLKDNTAIQNAVNKANNELEALGVKSSITKIEQLITDGAEAGKTFKLKDGNKISSYVFDFEREFLSCSSGVGSSGFLFTSFMIK